MRTVKLDGQCKRSKLTR